MLFRFRFPLRRNFRIADYGIKFPYRAKVVHYNIEIEADGNVSFENAEKMRKAGVNIFVAGTSSVFRKDLSLENGIKMLREAIK